MVIVGKGWQYTMAWLMFLFYIRANRTQFANVSLHSITDDDAAEVLALPALEGYGDEGKKRHIKKEEDLWINMLSLHLDLDDEDLEPPATLNEDFSTVEQLADDMITMSLEPRAKWHNLLNLDTIKVRTTISCQESALIQGVYL